MYTNNLKIQVFMLTKYDIVKGNKKWYKINTF